MLNNLGSVSQIEMDILKTDVLHWCGKYIILLCHLYYFFQPTIKLNL